MAAAGVALVTEQSARLLPRKFEHLGALRNRLRKLELARVDPLEVFTAPCSRRSSPVGRRAQRAQVDIIDSGLCKRVSKQGLGEAGPP